MKKLILIFSIIFTSSINAQTFPDVSSMYFKLRENDKDLSEVNRQLVMDGRNPSELITGVKDAVDMPNDYLVDMNMHIKYFKHASKSNCTEVMAMAYLQYKSVRKNFLIDAPINANLIRNLFVKKASPSERVLFLQTARTIDEIVNEMKKSKYGMITNE